MMSPSLLASALVALTLPLTLGACRNQSDKAELAPLDEELTKADPAVKGSLEDQIMVDPKLAQQSNRHAVTPGNRPVDGGVPAIANPKAAAEAEALAASSAGKLLRAPAAQPFEETCETCGKRSVTLGAMARDQVNGGKGATDGGQCAAKVTYGREWAQRMPAWIPVYPRALVKEAAGVAGGTCNVRVVNFQTHASRQAVLDYYYTLARRAGYTAEHRLKGAEHYLGGTRGDNAYVVMLRQDGGVVDVDIVASGGR